MKQFTIQGPKSLKKAISEETGIPLYDEHSLNYSHLVVESDPDQKKLSGVNQGYSTNYVLPQDWDKAIRALRGYFLPKFKVGDVVVYDNGLGSITGPYKLKEEEGTAFKDTEGIRRGTDSGYYRLASEVELALWEKRQIIYIGTFPITFKDSYITVEEHNYSKELLLKMQYILSQDKIHSIRVGCTGQYEVNLDLINKILKRLR